MSRKPYLTNTEGNVRHDALNIVKAAFAIDENILKTELNDKGNKSMKLESLARLNGFESSGAHSALFDTELTVKILDLIRKKQPILWSEYLKTSSKVVAENLIKQENIFTLNEYFYGKSYLYLCAPLHPNSCVHPIYKWGQAVDLKVDVEVYLSVAHAGSTSTWGHTRAHAQHAVLWRCRPPRSGIRAAAARVLGLCLFMI